MSIKEQLTPEQYKSVFNAPLAAATYVASASGGTWEMAKEVISASKFIAQEVQSDQDTEYGELVNELLKEIRGMSKEEAKGMQLAYEQTKDIDALRVQLMHIVADGWSAVAAMPGADGYASWVVAVARDAALTKTGGHFGIGNKSVIDDQEQAALDELAGAMVIPASDAPAENVGE